MEDAAPFTSRISLNQALMQEQASCIINRPAGIGIHMVVIGRIVGKPTCHCDLIDLQAAA